MLSFDIPHNEAFRSLGAKEAGQHWSAFDVPKPEARKGNATRFVTTIWNYHSKRDERKRRVPTEVAIRKDRVDGSYWYRVEKPVLGTPRKTWVAHWDSLQLALELQVPTVGVLKDYKTGGCALDAVFDCAGGMYSRDGRALWLQLRPRGSVEIETATVDIQELTIGPYLSLPLLSGGNIFPDEVPNVPAGYIEGAVTQVVVNKYERSAAARKACVDAHGCTCAVCKFDFGAVYGALGQGFIHVHHLIELSSIGEAYEVDPIKDLRPVCPNCHAMLHRRVPALSIEELRVMLIPPHHS